MAGGIRQSAGGEKNVTPQQVKAEQRQAIRARWKSLSATERATGSSLICRRLKEQDFWKQAKIVMLFAPLPDEADVWPLLPDALMEGKIVTLPRYDSFANCYAAAQITDRSKDLSIGAFGVQEPAAGCAAIPFEKINLALIPGVGFDTIGNRLGRGKGFYDRLLTDFAGIKCGVALEEQITETIPVEGHDIQMDMVITPERLITARI